MHHHRSKVCLVMVVLVALLPAACMESQRIDGAHNEMTGSTTDGATSQQSEMQEKDQTIVKRQAVETDDREVEYPQAQQGDKLMEMFEALNTSIMTEFEKARSGQEVLERSQRLMNISILTELDKLRTDLLSKIETCHQVYQDCHSAWEQGVRASGVYTITPLGYQSFDVRCEFDNQHGWTVIQRRYDGSVNFYLPWASYKSGFGDPNSEYWLGNDNIYALTYTNGTNRKLSIYLRRYDGQEGTANYSTFYINNEEDNYRLTISGYSGSVEDWMYRQNNYQFSTRDRDNDNNCAVGYTGAWWYNQCTLTNLNGVWTNSSNGGRGNIWWHGSWGGYTTTTIQQTTMSVTRED